MAEIQQLLAKNMAQTKANEAHLKSFAPQLEYLSGESGYKKAKPDFPITSAEGLAKLERQMESDDDFKNAVVRFYYFCPYAIIIINKFNFYFRINALKGLSKPRRV